MDTANNTVEVWRRIPSAPAYDVSNLGRVRSWLRPGRRKGNASPLDSEPHLIAIQAWARGRAMCQVQHSDGKHRLRYVSHLVAEAFIGPRPAGMVVAHRNDIPWDNRPENLHYATQSQNVREAYDNGALLRGAQPRTWGKNPRSKLDAEAVRVIRRRRAAGERPCTLAREYGVSATTIAAIVARRVYAWVKDDPLSTEMHKRVTTQARAMRAAQRALEKTENDCACMARMLETTERKAA